MTKRIAVAVAAVAILLAAVAIPALGAARRTVAVKGFKFSPSVLRVKAGTTVTWKIGGDPAAHNVTVTSGPVKFRSKTASRLTFSQKLTRKGTYKIVCTIHPNMHETVSVS